MKKSDITYIVGCTFVAATGLFYCSVRWFKFKLPRYYPIEHVWKTTKEPGVPSQLWFSMQVFAFLCAAVVAVIVYLVLKKTAANTELKPSTAGKIGMATSGILAFCLTYIICYEFSHWGIL